MEVLKRQLKPVALTALLRMSDQVPGSIDAAFIFSCDTSPRASRDFVCSGRFVQDRN